MTKDKKRFFVERRDPDFPFYDEEENFGKREILILSTGILLFVFWTLQKFIKVPDIVRSLVYFFLALLPFLIVSKGKMSALIKKPRFYDIVLVIGGGTVLFIASLMVAIRLGSIGIVDLETISANPATQMEHDTLFMIGFLFQIFGEEMFKIDVFLVVLTLMYRSTGKRRLSVLVGMLVSSIIFGALHYNAYGNLLFVICVQGLTSGMIAMYLYLRTKNIMVPYFAHLLLDIIALLSA